MKAITVVGSITEERELGLLSGHRVAEALSRRGWEVEIQDSVDLQELPLLVRSHQPDVIVPVGFGHPTEDGTVFALAETLGVPCSGPPPRAGALAQDKVAFGAIVESIFWDDDAIWSCQGLQVLGEQSNSDRAARLQRLLYPTILKPTFGGSSIGLEVAENFDEALVLSRELLESFPSILAQPLIAPSREVSVAILGSGRDSLVFPVIELLREGIYGYEEKFGDGAHRLHRCPAEIPEPLARLLQSAAQRINLKLGMRGLARYDFLIQGPRCFVIELNAIPGMGETSIACDAAAVAGWSFDDVIEAYASAPLELRNSKEVA